MAYKTLIPGLVTLNSPKGHLNNMYISNDFSYYSNSTKAEKFHYTEICSSIENPLQPYDMRSEYFSKKGVLWHYNRPSRILPLALTYNTSNNVFTYTRAYSYIPFGIGGVFPPGELIADTINYHLFLQGYIIMRGIAYTYRGRTICITAPGCNGKTTFLDSILKKGAEYIAEDLLVLDINNNLVYPTCPFIKRHAWQKNRSLTSKKNNMNIVQEPRQIDTLYLTENTMSSSYTPQPKTISDFMLINDRYFLKNRLIRSMIFEEGTWSTVSRIMNTNINIPHAYIPIQQFNYEFLKTNH